LGLWTPIDREEGFCLMPICTMWSRSLEAPPSDLADIWPSESPVEELTYNFHLSFLPPGLFGRTIIRMMRRAGDNFENIKSFWAYGIVVLDAETKQLFSVQLLTDQMYISVIVREGEFPHEADQRKGRMLDLLQKLTQNISTLLRRWYCNLAFEEHAPVAQASLQDICVAAIGDNIVHAGNLDLLIPPLRRRVLTRLLDHRGASRGGRRNCFGGAKRAEPLIKQSRQARENCADVPTIRRNLLLLLEYEGMLLEIIDREQQWANQEEEDSGMTRLVTLLQVLRKEIGDCMPLIFGRQPL